MENQIDILKDKERRKKEKIKRIMSSDNYIEWLCRFTEYKNGFFDNDWIYFPELLSDTDREKVGDLSLFYSGIAKYAKDNYIYPVSQEFGEFYQIKNTNIGFEIGVLKGDSILYYCKRIPITNENDFIEFNDILSNKMQKQVQYINSCLESLSNAIKTLYQNGVSINAISKVIDETINEIDINKNSQEEKVLKKSIF